MAKTCQLSKMLTQLEPCLSWCGLLANSLQLLQEKGSFKSCFLLPFQAGLEDHIPDCMTCSTLHPSHLFLTEAACGQLCFPGPGSN